MEPKLRAKLLKFYIAHYTSCLVLFDSIKNSFADFLIVVANILRPVKQVPVQVNVQSHTPDIRILFAPQPQENIKSQRVSWRNPLLTNLKYNMDMNARFKPLIL